MAVATTSIYTPGGIVTGGFSGLGIVVYDLSKEYFVYDIPVWITTLVLNIPLFLVAYRCREYIDFEKCILAAVTFNVFLAFLPEFHILRGDMVLTAVYGGIINGIGIAFVLTSGAATGGTDLVAMLIRIKLPYKTVPEILFVVDGVVILIGMLQFGINNAMYAIISIYIASIISDKVIEGPKSAKAIYIMSKKSDEIAMEIMGCLERGVTGLNSVGMYTGREGKMLLCIVTKKEVVAIRKLAYELDKGAFLCIYDVREVSGEGFFGRE